MRDRMRSLGLLTVLLLVAAPARAQDEVVPSQPVLPHAQLEGNAPPTIALKDAIGTALARNPTTIVAYAEIRRAQAIVEQVRAGALPTLYGSFAYTQLDAARTYNGSAQLPASAFQANALLTVPLIVPKPWAQWSQETDQVDTARLSAEDTRRVVAVAVKLDVQRRFLQRDAERRRQLARKPDDRQRVRPVGGDVDVEHRIGEPEVGDDVGAGRDRCLELHDPVLEPLGG